MRTLRSKLLLGNDTFCLLWAALGDPGGGQLTGKTGNDKVNGARGADDKQETKPEGAGEKKRPGKKYGDHRPEPSREGPLSKMALPPGRGWYFCKIEEREKGNPK